MPTEVAERIKVIDTDAHVSEPEDLWTLRVSTKKWGELVPHVKRDTARGIDFWYFGGEKFMTTAGAAQAGWKEWQPSFPPTLADADPAAWRAADRLTRMDEFGLWGQVIYPNAAGFGSGRFLTLKEPELMLDCVRAYNDFLVEWCSADPRRLVPVMSLPFWDVEACVQEIHRSAKLGHKGILFSGDPNSFGQPYLGEPHWNPIWATAQDLGLPINFHVASGDVTEVRRGYKGYGRQAYYAKNSVSFFLDNSNTILEVIASGICHRYPNLNFVSVESGIGWVPFVLEAIDWHWTNVGAQKEHPEYDLLPSEYFKRQIYACFWFERDSAKAALNQLGPDRVMFETDFPHPTCMAPGPATYAVKPSEYIQEALSDLPEDVLRKILHDNAARIYHLE